MTVTLSVFAVVLILFVVNIILEHLINWWIRSTKDKDETFGVLAIFAWIIKTLVIVALLHDILT